MKLKEIKKNGFYTDGEFVYRKEKNNDYTIYQDVSEETKHFLKAGVRPCGIYPFMLENEVRMVEDGEEFFNGNIKVLNKKQLEVVDCITLNREEDAKGYTISHDGYKIIKKVINF